MDHLVSCTNDFISHTMVLKPHEVRAVSNVTVINLRDEQVVVAFNYFTKTPVTPYEDPEHHDYAE